MDFMRCTTCRCIVQVNPTGICLGCQRGFIGPQEDVWKPTKEEIENAAKEREESESDFGQYKNRNQFREKEITSDSNSVKRRRKIKE